MNAKLCRVLPHRWEDYYSEEPGWEKWGFGHNWDVGYFGPTGSLFVCRRCGLEEKGDAGGIKITEKKSVS